MTLCGNCGNHIGENAKACGSCGIRFTGTLAVSDDDYESILALHAGNRRAVRRRTLERYGTGAGLVAVVAVVSLLALMLAR